MSSSRTLKREIQEAGPDYQDQFSFEVLFFCGDKNSLILGEMTVQVNEDCIHNENNYNRAIASQRFIGPTKHTPETVAKISESLTGRVGPNLGRVWPQEMKDRISDSVSKTLIGNKRSQKDLIIAESIATGETMEFDGTKQFEALGFNQGTVYAVIRGERKTHKGYRWYWKSDYNKEK